MTTGFAATANPLGRSLSGVPAKTLTRGYHLSNIPSNKLRIAADWALDAAVGRQVVHLGLVGPEAVPLNADHPCGWTTEVRLLVERGLKPTLSGTCDMFLPWSEAFRR